MKRSPSQLRQTGLQRWPQWLRRTVLASSLAAGLACSSAWAAGKPEPVTLNFQGAEIEAVARTFATITGKNVVVDPRVKGVMTLVTDKPVSRDEALGQFVSALRLQGYTLVDSAGLYKIVPEAEAKLQSDGVTVIDDGSGQLPSGNRVATQVFKLNYENANNLVAVLRPLISPNNTINANPGSNALVITDYADNLRRIARIIAAMDVANGTDVDVIPLKHAIAADLTPLILRLIGENTAPVPANQAGANFKTAVLPEPRSNALIVRASNPAQLVLVHSLVEKLDRPDAMGKDGSGNIHVVYLKNADATKLAATLRAALSGEARTTPAAVPGVPTTPVVPGAPAATTAAATTTGGQIQADVATNSLIITAPEPQYRQIRAVIEQLDTRRAQVFVESLIAEVSETKAAEFGIQWQGPLGSAGSGLIGLLGTNFSTGTQQNIINLATGAASGSVAPSPGLNVGAAQRVNGVYVLGFLARFLESTGSGNVLSTPNLLTLDNEEAKIVIGKNVPFVTGQFTNTNAGNGAVNPFQTIERKDVGLTLKVKPQISENGTVKLTIYQEVSSVLAATANALNGPTTSKRTIESHVLVDDGNIVVLGGLLQDEYSGNEDKVPGLGDVPIFGNLFKSNARSRSKSNLMVFLRPVVVRDAKGSDRLSLDRYDLMKSGMQSAQPVASDIMKISGAAQLPALSPDQAGRASLAVPANPDQPFVGSSDTPR
jgi:general secretion pathway protein D